MNPKFNPEEFPEQFNKDLTEVSAILACAYSEDSGKIAEALYRATIEHTLTMHQVANGCLELYNSKARSTFSIEKVIKWVCELGDKGLDPIEAAKSLRTEMDNTYVSKIKDSYEEEVEELNKIRYKYSRGEYRKRLRRLKKKYNRV